jgi:hypothetical protein
MTVQMHKRALGTTSPVQKIYSGRFAGANGADPTSKTVDVGVSVTRSGEGVWVVTLPSPMKAFKAVTCWATDNDGNAHDVQYALNATNRTITITHKTATYATLDTSQRNVAVTAELTDISTASSAFVAAPIAGTISSIRTVLHGAISAADATLTTEINGVAVTGSSITVAQSGSAAGDRDSATPSAANTVAVGDAIELITDGGSTDAARLTATYIITPAAAAGVAVQDVVDEVGFLAIVELADVAGTGV